MRYFFHRSLSSCPHVRVQGIRTTPMQNPFPSFVLSGSAVQSQSLGNTATDHPVNMKRPRLGIKTDCTPERTPIHGQGEKTGMISVIQRIKPKQLVLIKFGSKSLKTLKIGKTGNGGLMVAGYKDKGEIGKEDLLGSDSEKA